MNKFTKYRLAGELETTVSGKLLYLFLLDIVDAEGKIIMVDDMNEDMGITQAQEKAMLAGSLFGWHTPAAKPWNYDQNGKPRLPNQPKKNEPER